MKKVLLMLLAVLLFAPAVVKAVDFWMLNVHGGVGYPLGDMLGEKTNLSWDAGFSARKGFDREISAGGGITYVNLPYKNADAKKPFTAVIINAQFVYAPYLPDFFLWPYAKVGLGVFLVNYMIASDVAPDYKPISAPPETAFGILLGGGVNYPLTNEIAANFEIMYNQASLQGGQGDNYNFLTFNAGIMVFIK